MSPGERERGEGFHVKKPCSKAAGALSRWHIAWSLARGAEVCVGGHGAMRRHDRISQPGGVVGTE